MIANHSQSQYTLPMKADGQNLSANSCQNCLSPAERHLLCAFRWWLTGSAQCDRTANDRARKELEALVGTTQAHLILAHFDIMIRAIALCPRRSLRYHPPWCSAVCRDELLLLALAATHQHGSTIMGAALADVVSGEAGSARVCHAAEDLAQSVLAAGVVLTLTRSVNSAIALGALGLVRLH